MIGEAFMKSDWLRNILEVRQQPSQRATDQMATIDGTVLLHISVGQARLRMLFRVVRNLTVPILHGKAFIDRLGDGIFPPKHMIVL